MTVKGFHHVALCSDCPEKSLEFYKALGGKEIHRFNSVSSGKTIYLVELAKGAVIEILPKPSPATEGCFPHIAIETDDCEKFCEAAVAAGAKTATPSQEVMLGTMKVKNAFLKGPDGETIEPFELK